MNWKKLLIAFAAAFVVSMIYNIVVHEVILSETYQELQHLWRPDMDSKMWIGMVTGIIFVFFFVYIFVRGYENKGFMEGIRYGLVIWAFVTIPGYYGQYMIYDLPYSMVIKWVMFDLVLMVLMGIVAALIYKPAEKAA